jgi:glycosyltransferase involved in cell wall biosynthesis
MKEEITFLIPSMHGGGAQKVMLLLVNELCKRGWQITLLLSNIEGAYLKRLDKKIKVIFLKNQNISANLFEIARYLKHNKPTFFYSSMTYVNAIAGLAVILSRFRGKFILSEHMNLSAKNAHNKTFINKVITRLAKITYKKADVVVCVSQGVQEDLNAVIRNLKKTIVIYNPVEDFFRKRSFIDNKFKIISMGRLEKEKNFTLLIEAFSIMLNKTNSDNTELYILGEGKERKDLEALINERQLQDRVFLKGFVEDPGELLSSCDLFVMCSTREGFGNVLVEALSCGLPVISSDCPSGPSEILGGGKFGKLLPVNDKESLANAIIEAINFPNAISTKEERIRRANEFSVESIVDKYESLFHDILKADCILENYNTINQSCMHT